MQSADFWKFITDNINESPTQLRLKWHGKKDLAFDVDFAILQIECRQKFKKKLSQTLERDPYFLFPSALAGEQSTSDQLAAFHATLLPADCAMADLTAGLGIDAIHASATAKAVTAIEKEELKAEILKKNIHTLGIGNINVVWGDCTEYVKECGHYDAVFIDPARRDAHGARVYALSDCAPDVLLMLDDLKKCTDKLIIKASPMLDISKMKTDLGCASRIIALGTPSECKELIAVCDFNPTGQPKPCQIDAVTLLSNGERVSYSFTAEKESRKREEVKFGVPKEGEYLYEPYPAVMKAGSFFSLARDFSLSKLSPNTHLYFSKDEIDGFPGEIFKIERVMDYASKYIKRFSKEYPIISVGARNFDMKADDLRKKLGVKDGGHRRVIGATSSDSSKHLIVISPLA